MSQGSAPQQTAFRAEQQSRRGASRGSSKLTFGAVRINCTGSCALALNHAFCKLEILRLIPINPAQIAAYDVTLTVDDEMRRRPINLETTLHLGGVVGEDSEVIEAIALVPLGDLRDRFRRSNRHGDDLNTSAAQRWNRLV